MSPLSANNNNNTVCINITQELQETSGGGIGGVGSGSDIAKFYEGKSIFVTGATGFLGKAVIEKLLRTTHVKMVFILIRARRGQDVQARLDGLLTSSVFDKLRCSTNPVVLDKICPIVGDITLPGLGISDEDQQLLHNEVSIVIHCAATIKFNEPLRVAAEVNVAGTKRVLDLCKQMKNLTANVHVSTAYANCDREVINEVVYPTPMDPQKLLQACDSLDDEILDSVTTKILGPMPNTYTFTKAVAESLVQQASTQLQLPVCIVRPAIVSGALKEPMPGWVDNLSSPTGIVAGGGTGVIRSVYLHDEKVIDFIPVDFVVNLVLASAWHTAAHTSSGTRGIAAAGSTDSCPVFNCCTGAENPLKLGALCHWMNLAWRTNPPQRLLWYPNFCPTSNRAWHNTLDFFVHRIPAYVQDICLHLSRSGRKESGTAAVKMYQKIRYMMSTTEFFRTHQYNFTTDNMRHLFEKMGPTDQLMYGLNVKEIDWRNYFEIYCLGIRRYVLKEDPSTLPASRRCTRIMYWTQTLMNIFLILCIIICIVYSLAVNIF